MKKDAANVAWIAIAASIAVAACSGSPKPHRDPDGLEATIKRKREEHKPSARVYIKKALLRDSRYKTACQNAQWAALAAGRLSDTLGNGFETGMQVAQRSLMREGFGAVTVAALALDDGVIKEANRVKIERIVRDFCINRHCQYLAINSVLADMGAQPVLPTEMDAADLELAAKWARSHSDLWPAK